MAVYSISQFTCVANITTKPFNPLLGETYEFCTDKIRICSEQTSHHPPITSNYGEGLEENFKIYNSIETKTKFRGTHMDFIDAHKVYIEIHNTSFIFDQYISDKSCVDLCDRLSDKIRKKLAS